MGQQLVWSLEKKKCMVFPFRGSLYLGWPTSVIPADMPTGRTYFKEKLVCFKNTQWWIILPPEKAICTGYMVVEPSNWKPFNYILGSGFWYLENKLSIKWWTRLLCSWTTKRCLSFHCSFSSLHQQSRFLKKKTLFKIWTVKNTFGQQESRG